MINSKAAEQLLDNITEIQDGVSISLVQKALVLGHDGATTYLQGYMVVGNIKKLGVTRTKIGVYQADTKNSDGQIIFLSGQVGSVAGTTIKSDLSRNDRISMALELRKWADRWLKQPVRTVVVPKTDDEPVYSPDPDPVVINELELASRVEPTPELEKTVGQPGLGYNGKKKKRKKDKADSAESQPQPSLPESPSLEPELESEPTTEDTQN